MASCEFRVKVAPQYRPDQSDPDDGVYGFVYTVTIANVGDVTGQLLTRHWVICDANGHVEEVRGDGVVGHQPVLKPGESFQYTSGTRLRTATGTMHGTYFCETEDGTPFEAAIPMFVLDAGDAGGAAPRVLH